MNKQFSIIVAISQNNVIGRDNDLIWHIPDDLKRFKALTTGHTIIMGRKTYDSLRIKPLPNRRNIVISRDENLKLPGCEVVKSVEEAIIIADNDRENFIIGGSSIYQLFMPFVQKMYITDVDQAFEGDVFFPKIDFNNWKLESQTEFVVHNDIPYRYTNYIK